MTPEAATTAKSPSEKVPLAQDRARLDAELAAALKAPFRRLPFTYDGRQFLKVPDRPGRPALAVTWAGEVWNFSVEPPRPVPKSRGHAGYYNVGIRVDGKPCVWPHHHFIVEAHYGPRPEVPPGEKYNTLHLDDNRLNNHWRNLRHGTERLNRYMRLKKEEKEGRNRWRFLTKAEVAQMRRQIYDGHTKLAIAGEFGVCPRTVYYVQDRNTHPEAGWPTPDGQPPPAGKTLRQLGAERRKQEQQKPQPPPQGPAPEAHP